MLPQVDTPSRFHDADGAEIVLVPIRDEGRPAKLLIDDYRKLVEAGLGGDHWWMGGRDTRYVHCGSRTNRSATIVARLIADAGPEHQVGYLDGDRRNLRRDNLWLRTVRPRRPLRRLNRNPEGASFEETAEWLRRRAAEKGAG